MGKNLFQNPSDEEYNPDGEGVESVGGEDVVVKGDVESESDSSGDGEDADEGSDIETPNEDVEEEEGEEAEGGRGGKDKRYKNLDLIGPRIIDVPTQYNGTHSYMKYVRNVIVKMRGEEEGKRVLFPDWMPSASDWKPVPERYSTSVCT